jgi:hypothetical protein
MARNTLMPTTGKGPGRIVATVVVVALLVMVVRDPVGAAHAARALGTWIGGVLDALGRFGSTVSH